MHEHVINTGKPVENTGNVSKALTEGRRLLNALKRNATFSPDPTLIPRKEAQLRALQIQDAAILELREPKPQPEIPRTIVFTKPDARLNPRVEIPKDIPTAEDVAKQILIAPMQYQLYDLISSGQLQDAPNNSKYLIGTIYGDKDVKNPQKSFRKLLADLRENIEPLGLGTTNIALKPARQSGIWIISRLPSRQPQLEVTK